MDKQTSRTLNAATKAAMNGGPFAPMQAPRSQPMRPVKGMTILRFAVLAYIEDRGPCEFEGTAKAAATWLAKRGYAGRSGDRFVALDIRPPTHEEDQ